MSNKETAKMTKPTFSKGNKYALKDGYTTSQGVYIPKEVTIAAKAGPSIEEILADMDKEEQE